MIVGIWEVRDAVTGYIMSSHWNEADARSDLISCEIVFAGRSFRLVSR